MGHMASKHPFLKLHKGSRVVPCELSCLLSGNNVSLSFPPCLRHWPRHVSSYHQNAHVILSTACMWCSIWLLASRCHNGAAHDCVHVPQPGKPKKQRRKPAIAEVKDQEDEDVPSAAPQDSVDLEEEAVHEIEADADDADDADEPVSDSDQEAEPEAETAQKKKRAYHRSGAATA